MEDRQILSLKSKYFDLQFNLEDDLDIHDMLDNIVTLLKAATYSDSVIKEGILELANTYE